MRLMVWSWIESVRLAVLGPVERLFEVNRPLRFRILVAILALLLGLGISFLASGLTGSYFSSITIITTIFVTLISGFVLGTAVAIALALAADFFLIPPFRSVLDSEQSIEHFFIVVSLAIFVSILIVTLRETIRKSLLAKRDAEIAHASMEQILSTVSHDIRNSLQVSLLAVDSMNRAYDKPKRLQFLVATALTSIERTDKMIQTLLDSRARSGRSVSRQPDYCDLSEVVQKVYEQLSFVHGDRFQYRRPEPIMGLWDTEGIHRAIENLGINAVKYGFKERPITIFLQREADQVILSIHNEGEAIAESERSKLFDRYFRAESAHRENIKGWGLGLAVVKEVAEAHGGTVTVASQSDTGTTFTITAPIRTLEPIPLL